MSVLQHVFRTRNQRLLKTFGKIIRHINVLESDLRRESDQALRAKTDAFRHRLEDGLSLDELLPEAFAVVREASRRVLGLRHFDVQLMGGIVLHQGKITEMKTGEGKTLAATLPAYLNALQGNVHVVTVNDYLAKRDAEWMAPVYRFLGLSVGVIVPNLSLVQRRKAYQCDIVYGTNNEFGFDYLRDNMAFSLEECVQGDLEFAIIDEIDSILIDEARTPLIISGPLEDDHEIYGKMDQLVSQLTMDSNDQKIDNARHLPGVTKQYKGDFIVDQKNRQIHLTDLGHAKVEELFEKVQLVKKGERYHLNHINLLHYLDAALRAHHLYQRDIHYVVAEGQVVIVDEHTGRTMQGRRWSESLHQAVEAKEKVKIQSESQTLASITLQNFFRLYRKLSGMTGTADTEAYEFQQIYGLEVVVIPTNKPMVRTDMLDCIYLNANGKYAAIVKEIRDRHEKGQPILVGTTSIESSELLSRLLKKEKIEHQVLNAKYHEKEAQIISQAGRLNAVTIATNMAGRGTDIVLGGNWEAEIAALTDPSEEQIKVIKQDWEKRHQAVLQCGGLHVLGTERNESRRIDNQLRGRSGRQGDPGSSQFYLSLEDNLLRIFASERVSLLMKRLGMEEDKPITHRMIAKAIENAQHKVEAHYFDIRKQLLKYDDVANEQRQVVYQQRRELMLTDDLGDLVTDMRESLVKVLLDRYLHQKDLIDNTDLQNLALHVKERFHIDLSLVDCKHNDLVVDRDYILQKITAALHERITAQEALLGKDILRRLEKFLLLQVLDQHWKEHLVAMDYLRQGIHLRGYAQKEPIQEYRRESFELFGEMLEAVKEDILSALCRVQVQDEQEVKQIEKLRHHPGQQIEHHPSAGGEIVIPSAASSETNQSAPFLLKSSKQAATPLKVSRNSPCPCGSGKRYKNCHGRIDLQNKPVSKVSRNSPCSCGSGKKYKHCHGQIT